MKKMKAIFLMLILLVTITIAAACSSNLEASPKSKGDGQKEETESIKIGFQVYGLRGEFATNLTEEMKAHAKEIGVELVVMDGNYDVSTAISQLKNLESQQVDAIIINPIDEEALNATVDGIIDAGTPVLGVNAFLTSEKLTSYICSPDVVAGETEAQQVVDALGGKGNVVLFERQLDKQVKQKDVKESTISSKKIQKLHY